MDIKRTPHFRIVVLMIACAGAGLFALPGVRAQQRVETVSDLVKLAAETVSVRQCMLPIDAQRQDEVSQLQLRYRITNVSNQPLIIYRYGPAGFDARISTTLADLLAKKFVYEQRSSFARFPVRDFAEAVPGSEFRVLQPSETFVYEYPETITVTVAESVEPTKKPLEGDYFMEIKVATWVWEMEKAEKLKQRWAQHGNFFYYDVVTEPFPFTVNKPGATTTRCNTL